MFISIYKLSIYVGGRSSYRHGIDLLTMMGISLQ